MSKHIAIFGGPTLATITLYKFFKVGPRPGPHGLNISTFWFVMVIKLRYKALEQVDPGRATGTCPPLLRLDSHPVLDRVSDSRLLLVLCYFVR
jgi:hypothetical protein